jgi:hypothetical protein
MCNVSCIAYTYNRYLNKDADAADIVLLRQVQMLSHKNELLVCTTERLL